MTHHHRQIRTPHLPAIYKIRVHGHLGQQWQAWFEGLKITTLPDGDTVISGPMVDQAALYGILKKVRNLGLPLISVNPVPSSRLKR